MTLSNPIVIWLVVGIVMMLAELILPGGIIILLGGAALVVSGALALGIIEGVPQALTLWFIVSIAFVMSFRQVTQKLVGGDSHVANTDEELDLFNQVAVVKQTIGPGQQQGRIEFQGTDWTAIGDGSQIQAGTQVRVICRDNIALVVEPISTLDSTTEQ